MHAEHDTPLAQRYLWVEGHLSSGARQAVQEGLPDQMTVNSRVCFVGFAYADLPLPKEFDTIFRIDREEDLLRKHLASAIDARVLIVAATQQFGKVWQELPHGWKTVCVIEFPQGVPAMIDELPTVDGWYESDERVALCSRETWLAMQHDPGASRQP